MSWRDRTCYTYRGLFIPMCLGSAISGKQACTCNRARAKRDQLDRLEARVEKLETVCAALEQRALHMTITRGEPMPYNLEDICDALDMRPPLPDEKAASYALMEQLSTRVELAPAPVPTPDGAA